MESKRGIHLVVLLSVILFTLIVANIIIYSFTVIELRNNKVTGEVTGESVTGEFTTGEASSQPFNVSLQIVTPDIIIYSPQSITYYFDMGDIYELDLNVSESNLFSAVDSWWYTLIDLDDNSIINDSVIFTPNTTIIARRGSNQLRVYANTSTGEIINNNVTFSIFVPNSAPYIETLDDEIFVCEEDPLIYSFAVTDLDEDILTSDISPKDPFYTYPVSQIGGINVSFQIISGILNKNDAGGANNGYLIHPETVSISDNYNSTCCSDSREINITVLEINTAPGIEDVGVQTVWTSGDNSTFYKQANVFDQEDGDQDSGALTFDITITNSTGGLVELFNISSFGVMNYSGKQSDIGVYSVSFCVTDNGLLNPHINLTDVCGAAAPGSLTSCNDFGLTVTNESRPPVITSYSPANLSINSSGDQEISFSIVTYDPDGTIPDAMWYVNGILYRTDSGSLIHRLDYTFGCGVSGEHSVEAVITDDVDNGLNDSIKWNITIINVDCLAPITIGGGGGGGPQKACQSKIVCGDWNGCTNLRKAVISGNISGEDYRDVSLNCSALNLDDEACGFQMRSCFDINNCTNLTKIETTACVSSKYPSCNDGIKNCHDGSCEIFIDCGGPCMLCPGCSDDVQNQGEEGIDCGGPCPWECPVEKPILNPSRIGYMLLILLILLIAAVATSIIRIVNIKNEVVRMRWYYVLALILFIILVSIYYFYPQINVGDFVYKKGELLIGEVKEKSFLPRYNIEWQNGRLSEEYIFSIGKVSNLNEVQIKDMVKANNEEQLSYYSWNKEGEFIVFEPPGAEKASPDLQSIDLTDFENYSIFLAGGKCIPEFMCGVWGECQINYNMDNMIYGGWETGKEYRICKDVTGCMSNFMQQKNCAIKEDISIRKEINASQDYLEIYDKTNKIIFKLVRDRSLDINKLNIQIII